MKTILYLIGVFLIVAAIVFFSEVWPAACLFCWGLLAFYAVIGIWLFDV